MADDAKDPSLAELDARLAQAERRHQVGDPARRAGPGGRDLGVGLRIATVFVAAVAVGGAVGFFLDRWLGTMPLMLILFLLAGFAAGVRDMIREASRGTTAASPSRRDTEPTSLSEDPERRG